VLNTNLTDSSGARTIKIGGKQVNEKDEGWIQRHARKLVKPEAFKRLLR